MRWSWAIALGVASCGGGVATVPDGGNGGGGGLDYAPLGAPIALAGVTNASDVTWKPSTDTFFVVADRVIYEYSADFSTRLRTIGVGDGSLDPEGISYLGATGGIDRLALAVEAPIDVVFTFDLPASATAVDATDPTLRAYIPAAAPAIANRGWEGVAFRPPSGAGSGAGWLYVCQEGEPGQVPIRVLRFPYQPAGTSTLSYADGSLAVEETWNALAQLGAVAGDLSGLHHDTTTDTLLVLSQIGSRLLRVDPATGAILGQLVLDRSPQYEGVTLTADGRLVLVSEPNFVEIFRLL